MERLTKRNEADTAYYYPNCFKECDGLGYSAKCDKCGFQDKVCEKLGEYEDLEEQGLLLKLPCRAGNTYYRIDDGTYPIEWEFINVQQILSVMDKIGKTVFLTQAEAEEALKRMEREE